MNAKVSGFCKQGLKNLKTLFFCANKKTYRVERFYKQQPLKKRPGFFWCTNSLSRLFSLNTAQMSSYDQHENVRQDLLVRGGSNPLVIPLKSLKMLDYVQVNSLLSKKAFCSLWQRGSLLETWWYLVVSLFYGILSANGARILWKWLLNLLPISKELGT